MKQKKETILSVLDSGTKEIVYHGKEYDEIKVTTSNGVYQFPEDLRDYLLSSQKHYERIEKNLREYGHHQGKAGVYKPNNTEIVLADLMQHKCHCPKLWAMYKKCLQAPQNIRGVVFENLKYWLSAENKDFSLNFNTKYPITFDVVSCLPPAWIKGWEKEDLFGWVTQYQIEDLIPAAGYEIGKTVFVPSGRNRDLVEGKIIAYSYDGEKRVHSYGDYFNYLGRKVLWYVVQIGDNRWDRVQYRQSSICFSANF